MKVTIIRVSAIIVTMSEWIREDGDKIAGNAEEYLNSRVGFIWENIYVQISEVVIEIF